MCHLLFCSFIFVIVAYVTALAHYSGLILGDFSFDYGIDGNFCGVRKKGNRYGANGTYLDFQLKECF